MKTGDRTGFGHEKSSQNCHVDPHKPLCQVFEMRAGPGPRYRKQGTDSTPPPPRLIWKRSFVQIASDILGDFNNENSKENEYGATNCQ